MNDFIIEESFTHEDALASNDRDVLRGGNSFVQDVNVVDAEFEKLPSPGASSKRRILVVSLAVVGVLGLGSIGAIQYIEHSSRSAPPSHEFPLDAAGGSETGGSRAEPPIMLPAAAVVPLGQGAALPGTEPTAPDNSSSASAVLDPSAAIAQPRPVAAPMPVSAPQPVTDSVAPAAVPSLLAPASPSTAPADPAAAGRASATIAVPPSVVPPAVATVKPVPPTPRVAGASNAAAAVASGGSTPAAASIKKSADQPKRATPPVAAAPKSISPPAQPVKQAIAKPAAAEPATVPGESVVKQLVTMTAAEIGLRFFTDDALSIDSKDGGKPRTYRVGDRLPNGDKIQNLIPGSMTVVTDARVIRIN